MNASECIRELTHVFILEFVLESVYKVSLLYTNYPAKNGCGISICIQLLPAVEVSRISDNYHYIPPHHKEETSNFRDIVPI